MFIALTLRYQAYYFRGVGSDANSNTKKCQKILATGTNY